LIAELKRQGWKRPDLGLRAKIEKAKVAVARRLQKETAITLQWIASRLQMGSWTYVFNLLTPIWNRKR